MSESQFLGIIPARYGSSRFPGKPLADIHGKPMIQRVWERVTQSTIVTHWIVATDDQRIADAVLKFGGKVAMTSTDLPSGTDRCKAVLASQSNSVRWVINVQGDEPFVEVDQIDHLAKAMIEQNPDVGTLVKWNSDWEDFQNPNRVKCVRDHQGNGLYFSRSPIPFSAKQENFSGFWKHMGMYAYSAEFLNDLHTMPASVLEKQESLEQLRWLECGKKILTIETQAETPCVDTPEDLALILKMDL